MFIMPATDAVKADHMDLVFSIGSGVQCLQLLILQVRLLMIGLQLPLYMNVYDLIEYPFS